MQAPTLGEFAQQFGGAYFSTEGALWRTLRLLLLQPGELTRRYLAGQRKHYVLPLRLYLTISIVILLAVRLLLGGTDGRLPVDGDFSKGEWSIVRWDHDTKGPMIKDGVFTCAGTPEWICRRLARRLDTDPKGLQREISDLGQRALSNLGGAMFVMLPLFAAGLKAIYSNRGMRYTEHLVFALHVQSFWLVMWGLVFAGLDLLTILAMGAVPVYAVRAMRRVYGGRWSLLLLRALLLASYYTVMLWVGLVGVAFWTLLA